MKKKTGSPLTMFLVFAAIAVLIVMVMTGFIKNNEKRQQLSELSDEKKACMETVQELSDMVKADSDEIYAKYAREKLGYGDPKERVYIKMGN